MLTVYLQVDKSGKNNSFVAKFQKHLKAINLASNKLFFLRVERIMLLTKAGFSSPKGKQIAIYTYQMM